MTASGWDVLDEPLAADWDPKPSERDYYRKLPTGDLGYLVRRDGKDCIRLDRPHQEIIVPFREGEWKAEHEAHKWSRAQVAKIAFEADRELCHALQIFDKAKKDWRSLHEDERLAWMSKGPKSPALRVKLYAAIMEVLSSEVAW